MTDEQIAKLYDQALVIESNGDYVAGELDPVKFATLVAQHEREWVGLTEEEARVKFESWHKAEYVQPLERYGHTYKNMHVRNRWQGWLAANGIKEKQND